MILRAAFAAAFALVPAVAAAYSPDAGMVFPDCFDDPSLCTADEACFDGECVDAGLICETSETCREGMHCDLRGGDEQSPGLCRPTLESGCSADADCTEIQICVGQPTNPSRRPQCAPDDMRCLAAWGFECRFEARLCEANDGCRGGEQCVEGRCTAQALVEQAADIERDPVREASVAGHCIDAGATPGGGNCPPADEGGSCAVGDGGPAPLFLAFGLLIFAATRRSRS